MRRVKVKKDYSNFVSYKAKKLTRKQRKENLHKKIEALKGDAESDE